jgi:DNA-binding CsgD family transcriptional regulator
MHQAVRNDEVALLREATALLDASGEPLERAQVHADLGIALRRAGRPIDAREPLRLAVDLAHRCGAAALEERALAELRAAGARPRRLVISGPGALTRSERRIAELAGAGRQNRQIAQELVVTLATVEYHLRNAYRKLGITSRTQLTEILDAEPPTKPARLSVRVLAVTGIVARSAPTPDSVYCRWESRSSAATATV